MNKLEETVAIVLEEIKPQHTETTFAARKSAFNRLLRFAKQNNYEEPCQALYDDFTKDDKGSKDIWFNLSHVVRLVDRAAKTHAKDRNGRLLNEPPLPTEEEVLLYFQDVAFPIGSDTEINYLIVYSEHLIRKYDLTESTVGQYRHAWIDIRRYCFDCGTTKYRKEIITAFIQNTTCLRESKQIEEWKWKINRKAAFVLIEVAETGAFRWGQVPHYDLSCGSAELDAVRDRYLQLLRERNLEKATLSLHDYVFRFGLKHAGITQYSELKCLDVQTVNRVIKGFADACNDRSVSTILPIFKVILSFLHEEGIVKQDYSGMVMHPYVQRTHVRAFVPSEEDEILEKALESETPRNKAMILLALKLGLRDIDICTFTFNSLDWKHDQINIVQKKTDVPLTLPLLPVVGNAIMEYVLNDRPQPDDGYPYVFRRQQAPYNRLQSAYPICAKFLERNGIHVSNNTSKGVHVFRYTLVNRLLRAKTPHQVITDTLGHTSKESDKPYLSMEVDMLRQCALNLSFTGTISWKGGRRA